MTFDAKKRPRLKRYGRRTVVRDRYQRAQVHDLGSKWKLFYWDYTQTPRQRRTKTWSKSKVPSQREAQRLADQFMEKVNERNNQPHLFSSGEVTLQTVFVKCREQTWLHLKNSTRKQYEENFKTYLLPKFGSRAVRKLTTVDLQAYFKSLSRNLSPKSVRLIHGTLRAALNQSRTWGMLDRNPAVGVKLPRKKAVKPPVLLPLVEIRLILETVKEPTKSLLVLMVFASLRPGEALALRWKDVLRDRIVVDERVYDGEFDEVKTEAGEREVPFDKHGVILGAFKRMWESNRKFRRPDDLVFANRAGRALDRRNLLRRHLKPAVKKLGLPKRVDFRSFRTMHSSLVRRCGARLEIARDNMGHAGNTGSVTLDVYSKTWWEERVQAVTMVVEAVFTEPDADRRKKEIVTLAGVPAEESVEWEPFWEPQANGTDQNSL
jgi:integrase